jgi:hypothetical protein
MQFQRVNRTNAEQAFGLFKNVSGATILGNYPVAFTTLAASADGHQAVVPATGSLFTFAGIADADVADTEVGLYQCYGFRNSTRIFATGTSQTVATGVLLGPANASNGVNSTGLLETYGPLVSMEAIGAIVNSGGGYAKTFIRLM